jgi:hypothetical protein
MYNNLWLIVFLIATLMAELFVRNYPRMTPFAKWLTRAFYALVLGLYGWNWLL